MYPILKRETSASHLGDIVIHLTLNSGLVPGASRLKSRCSRAMRRGQFWTSAMLAREIVRSEKKGSMAADPQASSRADSVLQPVADDIASTTSSLLYSLALLHGTDMLFSCARPLRRSAVEMMPRHFNDGSVGSTPRPHARECGE